MKKLICLKIFVIIYSTAISQQKLPDGVYLVDKLTPDLWHFSYLKKTLITNKALITFNASFVEEPPEDYGPLLIFTDDFVPLEFSLLPILQKSKTQTKILLSKLTEEASEKLKEFTERNIRRYVVIVVNGEALTVHKIKKPITSGLVQMASSTDNAYNELYNLLKKDVKE